ncbi:hypothetical protein [Microcystis aeruginosa]|nr:hypothetical protein [Microcystis aeruginosa]
MSFQFTVHCSQQKTPHTPHPTPHFPHPTPHTPHPTPHTLSPHFPNSQG